MNTIDLWFVTLLALAFAASASAVLALRSFVLSRRDPVLFRLERMGARPSSHGLLGLRSRAPSGWFRRTFEAGGDRTSRLREQLAWADIRHSRALTIYFACKVGLAVGAGSIVLVVDHFSPLRPVQLAAALCLCSCFGFYSPTLWLLRRVERRQRAIARSLPDALDLLTSCVEAGLSLEASVARVAKEVAVPAPLLAGELTYTLREIDAGLPRSESFRRLAARTGVADLRSLAAVLVQTDMFGTAVGRPLRILSDGMRVDRLQRANERAATVGVRLTLPLILCLLPALVSVLLGGGIVRIVRTLLPALSGGASGH